MQLKREEKNQQRPRSKSYHQSKKIMRYRDLKRFLRKNGDPTLTGGRQMANAAFKIKNQNITFDDFEKYFC